MFIYHTKTFYFFLIQVPTENFPRNQLNRNKFWVWRDGSVVRIACCSCRGSEFGSQHSYPQLTGPVIPAPRDLTPAAGLCWHLHCVCTIPTNRCICICRIRNKTTIFLKKEILNLFSLYMCFSCYNCLLSHVYIIWSIDNYNSHQLI